MCAHDVPFIGNVHISLIPRFTMYSSQFPCSWFTKVVSGFWWSHKADTQSQDPLFFPELLCLGLMAVLLKLLLVQPRIHDKCPLSLSKESSTLPLALLGLQNNTKVTVATFASYILGLVLLIVILSHPVLLNHVTPLLPKFPLCRCSVSWLTGVAFHTDQKCPPTVFHPKLNSF